jgi:competence protein ComEC
MRKKLLIALCVFIGLGWALESLRPAYDTSAPNLTVWALSVGQGESILLREAGGKTVLFDGGPDDTVLGELSAALPFWDRHIDLMVLSHTHADHIVGLTDVLDRYDIGEIWTSGALQKSTQFSAWQDALRRYDKTPRTVFAGFSARLGTLDIRVLHPSRSMAGITPKDAHDATVVLHVAYGKESVLLTGDLNEAQESDVMAACPPPECSLASSVLQIPHHGSQSGLAPAFLAAVSPKVAFICVGIDNSYGHPGPNTLRKLALARIPYFRTDTDGRVRITLYDDRLEYERVRGSPPR